MRQILGAIMLAMATTGSAQAAEPMSGHDQAACTAPAAVPADLAGWSAAHRSMKAAIKVDAASRALLKQGVAADAALVPTPKVAYAIEPGKPGGSVSFGGLFAFDVATAGRYRVAQSGRSWVDVIVDGKAVPSVAHGHGPDCSGIAKTVEYDLPAGRHLLQIAANGEQALTVMVAPVR
ncbi:homogentisate 1,2-dioxygenase [Novosphingobium sp. fls2-241-R2A-195]|uniref:homogentisate 1,2-dioxygenase n=1 Tax=Novosphingobium sp. fls2-241-R2A-195 TaxID=3040296 RepID=UPI00254C96CB|nr:homogentisate 1,2-dioxygenase [Novosphingobium sp. fls2-241-R2A-195]